MAKSKKTKKTKEKKKPFSFYLKQIGFSAVNKITKGLKTYNEKTYPDKKVIEEETITVKEVIKLQEQQRQNSILRTSEVKDIHKALESKQKNKDNTILSFDRVTGELVISSSQINDIDNIVVDQIYKDGFFCNEKIAA